MRNMLRGEKKQLKGNLAQNVRASWGDVYFQLSVEKMGQRSGGNKVSTCTNNQVTAVLSEVLSLKLH